MQSDPFIFDQNYPSYVQKLKLFKKAKTVSTKIIQNYNFAILINLPFWSVENDQPVSLGFESYLEGFLEVFDYKLHNFTISLIINGTARDFSMLSLNNPMLQIYDHLPKNIKLLTFNHDLSHLITPEQIISGTISKTHNQDDSLVQFFDLSKAGFLEIINFLNQMTGEGEQNYLLLPSRLYDNHSFGDSKLLNEIKQKLLEYKNIAVFEAKSYFDKLAPKLQFVQV
jgi:hypothetical protein